MKKSIISILLVLAMILTGCGSKEPTEKTRPSTKGQAENSLTLILNTVTTTLDPQNFTLNVEDNVITQIYESLFICDNQGNFIPLLAENIEPAADGSSVTFKIRENVKFHSGDTLKGEDIIYTFERGVNSGITGVLNQYATAELVDEMTVKFNFPYAAMGAGFGQLYTYFEALEVVNKSYADALISSPLDNLYYNCDGTGAYKFDSIAVNGDITLTRFADYWGEASIDTVYFKVNTGDATLAFESGDIDYVGVTGTDAKALKAYSNVGIYEVAANYVAFTTLNISAESKLNDMNVRQAVAYAMNREDIATIASGGTGTAAYNMANPLVTYYADCCNHYEMDVEKSKSLMATAGYSESNKLALTLITMAANQDWIDACQVIKENLEKSYFTVTIEECADTNRFFTLDFDLGFIGVGLTTSFTSFSMLYDDNALNLCGITGDEQKAILDMFASMSDEASTQATMKAVVDTLGYIPTYYTVSYVAHDANLKIGERYNDISKSFVRETSWMK